jgi:RNA polymerase-binding protein DksA
MATRASAARGIGPEAGSAKQTTTSNRRNERSSVKTAANATSALKVSATPKKNAGGANSESAGKKAVTTGKTASGIASAGSASSARKSTARKAAAKSTAGSELTASDAATGRAVENPPRTKATRAKATTAKATTAKATTAKATTAKATTAKATTAKATTAKATAAKGGVKPARERAAAEQPAGRSEHPTKTSVPSRTASDDPAQAAPPGAATARASSRRTSAPAGTPASSPAQAPVTAATTAAEGATMAKTADSKTAETAGTKAGTGKAPRARSAADTEKIRAALSDRRDELKTEYDQTLSEIAELQRDRLTDSAGDDQADTGTKTFEREQEISLANSILERITQVERALERLDEGTYGWCERCGSAIPVERLAAFPSATLCVTCKQLEERR